MCKTKEKNAAMTHTKQTSKWMEMMSTTPHRKGQPQPNIRAGVTEGISKEGYNIVFTIVSIIVEGTGRLKGLPTPR
jgi:hypothetical protein